MIVPRRLPGIRIDVTPPPPAEVLPRMDISIFVGFAATGPTHRPVAIESVAEYALVFGPDAPLAYDAERGERLYAYLGASVRAFFSNGGRRCWVIRVARTLEFETLWCKVSGREIQPRELAVSNRFALAGVLALPGWGKSLSPAEVQACSLGSWSDGLLVQTALAATGFELKDCRPALSPPTACMSFCTTAPLQAGDLIELDDPAPSDTGSVRRYAIVDKAATLAAAGGLSSQVQVETTLCAAFEPIGANVNSPPSLTEAGTAEIAGVTAGRVPANFESGAVPGLDAKISFTMARSSGLVPGHWVNWSDGMQVIWLRIDQLDSTPTQADPDRVDVVAAGQAWRQVPKAALVFPDPVPTRAASLTLDLRVLAGQTEIARLEGMGLTAAHRAAWWRHISDALYYKPSEGRAEPQVNPSPSHTAARFPLAAMDRESGEELPLAWIPLGVNTLFGEALSPLPQTATALERDGLSRFDAGLFMDPELATVDAGHLIEQSDLIRFLSDTPRELFGIHAALSIGAAGIYNEASIIAVPDALHTGWVNSLLIKSPPVPSAVEDSPAHWYTQRDPCTTNNPDIKLAEPDSGRFLDCDTRKLTAPDWQYLTKDGPCSMFRLKWLSSEPSAVFLLEEARRADFKDARELYRGSEDRLDVATTREGIFYYRVTAIAGNEYSAASPTLRVTLRDEAWMMKTPAEYGKSRATEQLLSLHRNLLRLASASGELFAVLGLPRHYLAAEAIRHASRLRASKQGPGPADPEGFDFNERRALSYGALYHPWPVSSAPGSRPAHARAQQVYPPDGIAAGLLAARASLRGTWIAPANEPFREVSALTPVIEPNAWQALQDAQINLVRADARGFLTLSADTLSDELEWRPINVRRLLILLRRLALLRGVSYVFEPNDDVLRRAVERGFTFLLTDLFRRGAFAGMTPAESFMVVTSGAINTGADREAGRFFVELRVAPSLPLQFLTIRLSQTGERFTVLEGA